MELRINPRQDVTARVTANGIERYEVEAMIATGQSQRTVRTTDSLDESDQVLKLGRLSIGSVVTIELRGRGEATARCSATVGFAQNHELVGKDVQRGVIGTAGDVLLRFAAISLSRRARQPRLPDDIVEDSAQLPPSPPPSDSVFPMAVPETGWGGRAPVLPHGAPVCSVCSAGPVGSGSDDYGPAAARPGEPARAGRDDAEYTVWYATNRLPEADDPTEGYTSQRGDRVRYGVCRVVIPKSHKIGETGSPWWKRLRRWKDDRLRVIATQETTAVTHWQHISQHLRMLDPNERHGLVFIHGYNVSFQGAAKRAAQLGFDLGIKGAVSFFSWPSQGTVAGYFADSASIEASETDIANYLVDFATRAGATKVHVIAHSMGNRGLLRAVNDIMTRATLRSGVCFGSFILAAADVDAAVFSQLCKAYRRLAITTTLYVSGRDKAVQLSRFIHDYPRIGYTPPVPIIEGIDTVSVTKVDLSDLGHGYLAQARPVLQDIHSVIFDAKPPQNRMGLRPIVDPSGKQYWEIAA